MQHGVLILGFYKGKSAKNEPKISFGGWGAGRLWNYSLLTCTDPSQHWEQSHQRQRWDGTSHNPRCEETSRLDLCQVRWALLDNASMWRRKKLQFGTCPVRIAKLPLRHIFATVSLAPLVKIFANGSLKTNIGWTMNMGAKEDLQCLPSCSQGTHSFHGSRIRDHLSLCTCECVPASASYKENEILQERSLVSLWNVSPRVSNFVTSLSRFRREEPPGN